jgi:hypothetical protein
MKLAQASSLRAKAIVLLFGMALFAGACTHAKTDDIHVHSAADVKTNFKGYKTYGWYGSLSVLQDQTGTWVPRDRDVMAEVKFLVDKKMRELGLVEVKSNPDLLVGMLIVADVQQLQKLEDERGQAVAGFERVGKGALVVELVDAETNKTVWLGGAEGEAHGGYSTKQSNERLAYAVDKLFDELPR